MVASCHTKWQVIILIKNDHLLLQGCQGKIGYRGQCVCTKKYVVFHPFMFSLNFQEKKCARFEILGRILNMVYIIGLVIEEITEEVETVPSSNRKRSSTKLHETRDIPKTQIAADSGVPSNNSERLEALKNDPATLRFVLWRIDHNWLFLLKTWTFWVVNVENKKGIIWSLVVVKGDKLSS